MGFIVFWLGETSLNIFLLIFLWFIQRLINDYGSWFLDKCIQSGFNWDSILQAINSVNPFVFIYIQSARLSIYRKAETAILSQNIVYLLWLEIVNLLADIWILLLIWSNLCSNSRKVGLGRFYHITLFCVFLFSSISIILSKQH